MAEKFLSSLRLMMSLESVLTGRTEKHLAILPGTKILLHRDVISPVQDLQDRADACGLNLTVASGFRSFERQCEIWNAKMTGARAILDEHSRVIDSECLTEWEKVQAILRWSALPGSSRHHWGTDLDVYDSSSAPEGYKLQLIEEEYAEGGVFEHFAKWLDVELAKKNAQFYRPYLVDCGGVACEPWHLSYRPIAERFASELTIDVIASVVSDAELVGKTTVLSHLDEIYHRYIVLQGT